MDIETHTHERCNKARTFVSDGIAISCSGHMIIITDTLV